MKVIGVIPARYRSSRFPGKPLADICGHPMIWWVYEQCKKVSELDEIYVATDDERIAAVCRQLEMRVMMTCPDHHTGTDRVAEVASRVDGQVFINIQGDEPVIEPEMIRQLIGLFQDPAVSFGTLKREITDPVEIAASSTVKVVTDRKGNGMYFSRNPIPSNQKDGKQARVFRHVGIYGYRKEFLLQFASMPPTELELGEGIEPLRALENGYPIRVAETHWDSIGVDLPEHIAMVEQYLNQKREAEHW
ncbi:MAG: 3-deoxy-manno-octulosonate cytidylyltransferase [Massiliimalia sp.]